MKKIILLSLLFVFSFLFSQAQSEKNQGINFRELTFDQAIAQSNVSSRKLIPCFFSDCACDCKKLNMNSKRSRIIFFIDYLYRR